MTRKKKPLTITKRVEMLLEELSPSDYTTTAVLASELGWSVGLTSATITRIQEFEEGTATTVLSYRPLEGWKIATSWGGDKDEYVAWLVRHITTRIETASRHVAVAAALLPDEVPESLGAQMVAIAAQLEAVQAVLPQKTTVTPMKVPTRVEQIG